METQIFSASDRRFARAVSRLVCANPFLPERIGFEREALGEEFVEKDAEWNIRPDREEEHRNVARIRARAAALVLAARDRIARPGGPAAGGEDAALFEDLALFHLYHGWRIRFDPLIAAGDEKGRRAASARAPFFDDFRAEAARLSAPTGRPFDAAHLFALFFQIRRAYHHTFRYLIGRSRPITRLRAQAWQSIFTHDLRRYRRSLYGRMGDLTTLITGPSGTGKELVARAIGLSRYLPFDEGARAFPDFAGSFFPLNLSALSPTLIESELFGHLKGAFTGALRDRVGWLEGCPPHGTVFLDEIGDLDPAIQVKLLRVIETRSFQRLGETAVRRFHGKVLAATNRDLAREMQAGRFREDFYYRLCSDLVTTPSLREQLDDDPSDLESLVLFIARRMAGEEGPAVASEVLSWMEANLPRGYPWAGNVRELEQCVRNIVIRKEYRPPSAPPREGPEALLRDIEGGNLTADELLRRYAAIVYEKEGSYEAAARRLKLDRRTVKAKVGGVGNDE